MIFSKPPKIQASTVSCLRIAAFLCLCAFCGCKPPAIFQTKAADFDVIAYYAGNGRDLERYKFGQLTQVIFSFCHLRGNRLAVDNAEDSLTLRNLIALKRQHPRLKVLLSLGGWGGCEPCSAVFAKEAGRAEFVQSVKQLLETYGADGLDLDWEYPGVEGYPGHPYAAGDKQHFTLLVKDLRRGLGRGPELSFAAGGFDRFFNESVEWAKVMPLLNRVNVMTYDLVSGFSTRTGHHTPLYSTPQQKHSVDYAVRYLDSLGVPLKKIVIGAAFYARSWEGVDGADNGRYQTGKFKQFISYRDFDKFLPAEKGFVFYRDPAARAPYAYNAGLKEYATFDDPVSLAEKTRYAAEKGLGGIMFWQLTGDSAEGVLLKAIYDAAPKR